MQLKLAQREIVVNVSPAPFILLKLDDQKLSGPDVGELARRRLLRKRRVRYINSETVRCCPPQHTVRADEMLGMFTVVSCEQGEIAKEAFI